ERLGFGGGDLRPRRFQLCNVFLASRFQIALIAGVEPDPHADEAEHRDQYRDTDPAPPPGAGATEQAVPRKKFGRVRPHFSIVVLDFIAGVPVPGAWCELIAKARFG